MVKYNKQKRKKFPGWPWWNAYRRTANNEVPKALVWSKARFILIQTWSKLHLDSCLLKTTRLNEIESLVFNRLSEMSPKWNKRKKKFPPARK